MADVEKRVPGQKKPVPRAEQDAKTVVRRSKAGARKQIKVQVPTRLYEFMTGEITVADLDDEEVRRGQLKASDGRFVRPASWIPRELADAMRSEFLRRFQIEMAEVVPDALKAVRELVNSKHLAPGDATRLRAAELVLERNFGKVTQAVESHITVDKGKSFDDVIEASLVDVEDADEVEDDELDGVV